MPDEQREQDRPAEQSDGSELRSAEYIEIPETVRPAPPTPEPSPPEEPSGGVDPSGPVNQVRSDYVETTQESVQDHRAPAPSDESVDSE